MGRRTVYLLGLASLFNDMGSEAIYAVLPLYLGNTALVGLVGGLFNGLGNVLKVFFGHLSDRLGRRKELVVSGYALSAAAKTAMAVSPSDAVPLLVVVDRVGKGIRDSPRDAILAEMKRRGRAFGIHRAFDTTGALFGTLLAFLLALSGWPYAEIILAAGLISFLSVFPLLLLPSMRVEPSRRRFLESLASLAPGVKRMLVPGALLGAAFVSPMLLISGASSLNAWAIALYALYNVSYVGFALYFGSRSDRVGRARVILLGSLLVSLGFLSMAFSLVLPAFLLYGAGTGALQPALFASVGDRAEKKGTAMGVFQGVYGTATLVSSVALGLAMGALGNIAFVLYVPLALAGGTLAARRLPR